MSGEENDIDKIATTIVTYLNTLKKIGRRDLKSLKNGIDLGGLDNNYEGIVLSDVMRYFQDLYPVILCLAGF